MALNKGN